MTQSKKEEEVILNLNGLVIRGKGYITISAEDARVILNLINK